MRREKERMASTMLTIREAAAMFGISPSHVRRLEERGKFPSKAKLGRIVRYSLDVLTAWSGAGCPPMSVWRHGEA